MEFVRKIIDASSLLKIMQLPEILKNRKLETIVLPVDEPRKEISSASIGSSEISEITQSLIGSIPLPDVSLEDIKEILEAVEIPVHTIGYNANIKALENISAINEATSINADSDDVIYKLGSLFNAEM